MTSVYTPNLTAFRELAAGTPNLIPVYREFAADLATPVSVYIKLLGEGASFLLESISGGEQVSRYSFVGVNPRGMVALNGNTITHYNADGATSRELAAGEDILHELKAELGHFEAADLASLPRFIGGAVGFMGYDVVRFFEEMPATAAQVHSVPDAVFLLADTLVIFDHARQRLYILANVEVTEDVEQAYVSAIQRIERVSEKLLRPLPAIPTKRWGMNLNGQGDRDLTSNMTQAQYEDIVRQAKEYITAGDIFQVVLSQRLSRKTDAHPFAIYRALRMLNPSPYMFFFDFGELGFQVIGASPEMHVRLEDGIATVRPIAGTRWRGKTPEEDDALAAELLADEKERAEHVMLIDLGRNDLGRVSKYGTVQVKDQMIVERYSHVMHIVSQVEGEINAGMDAFDLLRATFPAGTLSGAPKIRAMQIIEELEGERRGLYGGVVGYIGYDGSMDTCIAIRTMLMQGNQISIQAGAGIVADSDPASEYQECFNKAKALSVAIARAEEGNL
jgi:anthranilate synthase component 1